MEQIKKDIGGRKFVLTFGKGIGDSIPCSLIQNDTGGKSLVVENTRANKALILRESCVVEYIDSMPDDVLGGEITVKNPKECQGGNYLELSFTVKRKEDRERVLSDIDKIYDMYVKGIHGREALEYWNAPMVVRPKTVVDIKKLSRKPMYKWYLFSMLVLLTLIANFPPSHKEKGRLTYEISPVVFKLETKILEQMSPGAIKKGQVFAVQDPVKLKGQLAKINSLLADLITQEREAQRVIDSRGNVSAHKRALKKAISQKESVLTNALNNKLSGLSKVARIQLESEITSLKRELKSLESGVFISESGISISNPEATLEEVAEREGSYEKQKAQIKEQIASMSYRSPCDGYFFGVKTSKDSQEFLQGNISCSQKPYLLVTVPDSKDSDLRIGEEGSYALMSDWTYRKYSSIDQSQLNARYLRAGEVSKGAQAFLVDFQDCSDCAWEDAGERFDVRMPLSADLQWLQLEFLYQKFYFANGERPISEVFKNWYNKAKKSLAELSAEGYIAQKTAFRGGFYFS